MAYWSSNLGQRRKVTNKHFHDKQFEINLKTEVAFGQPRKIAVITETNKQTTMGNVTELEEIIM